MRLDKFLSNMGIGTRTEVKRMIGKGLVTVNDEVIRKVGYSINESKDLVAFDGHLINFVEHVYLIMNKPAGVITARHDDMHQTVMDLIQGYGNRKLFPVGRLDKDTEGMLLITDDGEFNHQLMAPKKHVTKTYYVEVKGQVLEEHVGLFQKGITLDDGYLCQPAALEIITSGEISMVHLTISEGKYHQVKRMFKSLNMTVQYLKRIAIGSLTLAPDLHIGDYREMTEAELKKIKP